MARVLHVLMMRITRAGNLLYINHIHLSVLGLDPSLKQTKNPVHLSWKTKKGDVKGVG